MGGGSNLVVGDEGFPGLVVHAACAGQAWTTSPAELTVVADAGEPWDSVVAESVRRGASAIACLSGIPGSAGAAPVQNIGAYGCEIAEVIERLTVLDRTSLEVSEIDGNACELGYRDSVFKRHPERFVILAITLRFPRYGAPIIRYAELAKALLPDLAPDAARVRNAVLALRRSKSMVLDSGDRNCHSAGSFFTNPVVAADTAQALVAEALAHGVVSHPDEVPQYRLPDGRVKLAAAWLIERSGLGRGYRMGPVGISTQHPLALVHHGGGKTADLLRLALHVRRTVHNRFGVRLRPEPVLLGVDWPDLTTPGETSDARSHV
jgi:UDP-N-acetylmuramate dehydrogenase